MKNFYSVSFESNHPHSSFPPLTIHSLVPCGGRSSLAAGEVSPARPRPHLRRGQSGGAVTLALAHKRRCARPPSSVCPKLAVVVLVSPCVVDECGVSCRHGRPGGAPLFPHGSTGACQPPQQPLLREPHAALSPGPQGTPQQG